MNVIIMAGGSGSRFWPMSRARYPKQFLKIVGSHPLVEETFLRVSPLTEESRIYVVVHESHRSATEDIFGHRNVKILTEPLARNTAACIGLGIIHILEEHGDGPVVVLPADHHIGDVKCFQETLGKAIGLIDKGGIATIGVIPTRPETGYGYIKAGMPVSAAEDVFHVDAFVEKPALEEAIQFISEGGHYWNAGIFVFRAQTMMNEIRRHLPSIHEGLMDLRNHVGKRSYEGKLREVYEGITPISIDHGVMEKTKTDVFVISGQFPWSDVGSWYAVFELRRDEHDAEGNLVDGNAIVLNCKNVFVHSSSDRLIGCIGLKDITIVDTADSLLVCHRDASESVRECVNLIKEKGFEDLV
jgi:mannose-1-phosphate guanylyltransferase/mannose-6-phosphate isomerase